MKRVFGTILIILAATFAGMGLWLEKELFSRSYTYARHEQHYKDDYFARFGRNNPDVQEQWQERFGSGAVRANYEDHRKMGRRFRMLIWGAFGVTATGGFLLVRKRGVLRSEQQPATI